MSDVATTTIVVLWRRELHIASEALHACLVAAKAKPIDEKAVQAAARDAISAAYTALHSLAENPAAHVMVCDGERSEFVPRNITITPKDTP